MICTNCFANEGLRLLASSLAKGVPKRCNRCGGNGIPIDKDTLYEIAGRFFVTGSVPPHQPHSTPVFQLSDHPDMESVNFKSSLREDYEAIRAEGGVYVFHYGLPMWRVGLTTPHEVLESGGDSAVETVRAIIQAASAVVLANGTSLYRTRLGEVSAEATAFDAPPKGAITEHSRFDSVDCEILYAAPNIETCLHECRVTVADEITLATLRVQRDLRLLDLTQRFEEPGPLPFDSYEITIKTLCYEGEREYNCCRLLAREIHAAGYDGFQYNSYFSLVKPEPLTNVAIFGRPIAAGLISLASVNRVRLRGVTYDFSLGPADADLGAMSAK